jgi:hypothetical protein
MIAVVVFESMFGNTAKIAKAIAAGVGSALGPDSDVTVVEVGKAPAAIPDDVGLLIVGGPTHAFGMSRPGTRDDARRRVGDQLVSQGIGLREWLDTFGTDGGGLLTATFDTRIEKVRHLPGSAAKGAAKALRRRGFRPVVTAQSFYVADTEGPLVLGEPERARRWGNEIGEAFLRADHTVRSARE